MMSLESLSAGMAFLGAILGWRVSYVDLRITVDPGARQMTGVVALIVRPPAQPSTLVLDLADAMTVDSATIGTRRTAVERSTGHVIIGPAAAFAGCGACRVKVWYHGTPSRAAVGFSAPPKARAASYGLPNSAREWWPTIDDPSQSADSADITISAPRALTAVSNGRLVGRTESGQGQVTTHWAVRSPIYPDVVSFAVGDYTERTAWFDSRSGTRVKLDFFVFPEDTSKADEDFRVVPSILRFYESWLGAYPYPNEKYGIAEFERSSFREHQTITSLGASFLTGHHDADEVIAHEVAHQWFGDAMPVQSWRDIWLNESFAEYMAWQWLRTAHGDTAFEALVHDAIANAPAGALARADSGGFNTMFGALTFGKGPLVLVMLDELIGHDAMRAALGSYTGERHASAAAFERACERASGMSLDWFMRQWVDGSEIPMLAMRWNMDPAAGGRSRAHVRIEQRQGGPAFHLPISIVVTDSAGTTHRHRAQLTRVVDEFDIPVTGRPARVSLDTPHLLARIVP